MVGCGNELWRRRQKKQKKNKTRSIKKKKTIFRIKRNRFKDWKAKK